MQKKIFLTISIIFILSIFPLSAFAAETTENPIKVLLDGKEIYLDQPPVIVDDRALVPVRALTESLGATVSTDFSDHENRFVYINIPGYKVTLTIDSPSALINSNTVEMDVPTTIIGERTLVPLRFVAENFGAEVEWHPQERIIAMYAGRGTPIKIDPSLMPVMRVPATKIGFESHYAPAEYSRLLSSERTALNGDLFSLEGYVEEVFEPDKNGTVTIIVNSSGNKYSMLINNMRFGRSESIGRYYRFYGAFMSEYTHMPTLMLLRVTDSNGGVISAESMGFAIATSFEGETLETADEIKAFLEKNAQSWSMGTRYFTYEVKKGSLCDFTIVIGFNESHTMGNALRFANITDTQRYEVEELLKDRMRVIAYALTQKCPNITLEGYYYDSFSGYDDDSNRKLYTMRHASWVNDPDIKKTRSNAQADGPIFWLSSEDSSWY